MNKKKQREQYTRTIVVIITVIFILSSIAGIVLYRNDPREEFSIQGVKFRQEGDHYIANINKNDVIVYTLPGEASYINISSAILNKIKNSKMIYLTFDPEQDDLTYVDFIRFELTEELFENNIFPISGTLRESPLYQLPVVDCENATIYTPVIEFRVENKTNIYEEDNCIYIQAKGPEFIIIRDKIIFGLYGLT